MSDWLASFRSTRWRGRPRALKAINTARVAARARVWTLAGEHAPDHGVYADRPLIIDLDATLITAHSDKEHAAPTFRRWFGFHPLWAFVDHGADGTGEPLSFLLRKGNAGSNTAADHITVVKAALAQLPGYRFGRRPGRTVLIRADGAGCTHEFLNWTVSQRLSYSVGFTLPDTFAQTLTTMPKHGWTPAYDGDGQVRDGAWVADVTGLLDLKSWPVGMRVIVRKERPHPGAHCASPTRTVCGSPHSPPTRPGSAADLELRHAAGPLRGPHPHRQGHRLTNLPLPTHPEPDLVRIVALAVELTAWLQMLTLAGHDARRWEPKRLRLRLFSIAAA